MDNYFFDGFEDFFSAGDKAEKAKKANKPAASEKKPAADKAKTSKGGKDFEVTLPVTVKGRGFTTTIDGKGTMKCSKVRERLIEDGFLQFHMGGFKFFYLEEVKTIMVDASGIYSTDAELGLFGESEQETEEGAETTEAPVIISDGGIQCELTPSMFPDMDADEVSVKDVTERWVTINPIYAGCKLCVDNQVAYPVLTSCNGKHNLTSMEVNVFGEVVEVELEGKDTFEAVAADLAGALKSGKAVIVKTDAGYFLSVTCGKEPFYQFGCSTASAEKKKKVEKKYALPMTLYCVTWNMTYNLTSEMFDGKEKVTKDEITKRMARVEKMFADSDRKVDYLYNEERNLMSCMFISGKKG